MYLESSEQLDRLFPTSLHNNKFHIFQEIPKCLIQGYNFKYSQIIDSHNNWIIMILLDNGTDEEIYKHMYLKKINGDAINMSLINMEGIYGDIDTGDYSCHGYYIIKFLQLRIPFKQT